MMHTSVHGSSRWYDMNFSLSFRRFARHDQESDAGDARPNRVHHAQQCPQIVFANSAASKCEIERLESPNCSPSAQVGQKGVIEEERV
jgi:hypothetical protein